MKGIVGRENIFVRCSNEKYDNAHSADYEEGYYQLKEKFSVFDFAQAQSQLVRAQSEEAKARYDYLFKMKVMEFYLR